MGKGLHGSAELLIGQPMSSELKRLPRQPFHDPIEVFHSPITPCLDKLSLRAEKSDCSLVQFLLRFYLFFGRAAKGSESSQGW